MITQKTISVDGEELTLNCSDLKCNWILVYNNAEVLFIENVSNKNCTLETLNTIYEASTEQECLDEIKRLNLEYKFPIVEEEVNLLEKLKSKL